MGKCGAAGFHSQGLTPYESRRGAPAALPIKAHGGIGAPEGPGRTFAAKGVAGMPHRWTVALDGGSLTEYFWDRDLNPDTQPDEFWAAGGAQIEVDPVEGDPFWLQMQRAFPERTVSIKVGPYDGVLVWADPQRNGVRTHNVYWSDGAFNYSAPLEGSSADVGAFELPGSRRSRGVGSRLAATSSRRIYYPVNDPPG